MKILLIAAAQIGLQEEPAKAEDRSVLSRFGEKSKESFTLFRLLAHGTSGRW